MGWSCASCGGENPAGTRFCGHCGTPSSGTPAPLPPEPSPGPPPAQPPASWLERPPAPAADVDVDILRSFLSGQVAQRVMETGGRIADERRLITALFADVSGFTQLADQLDPEQLLEVIDPIIARLSEVVGRHDGYVSKFAGDALLALFGAPVSHEDDAARALSVALEMHAELDLMLPTLPSYARHLTLHAGVNSGHAIAGIQGSHVRMDYSALGDAINVAQRLEAAAPAGDTFVGETTYRLTHEHFDFEPVGPLTLKGKEKPVPAWRLIGRRRAPLPSLLAPFVGRAQEIERITGVIDDAVAGRGTVVCVTGDPGVGKSRLVDEARRRAEGRGLRWITVRCLSYGSAVTYWPYAELVRTIAGILPGGDPDAELPLLERALARLGIQELAPPFAGMLGLPAPSLSGIEPGAYRRLLHAAAASLLERLAHEQPTAVLIEDVHWADRASLSLTRELASLCPKLPVLLLLTTRHEGRGRLEEVLSALPPEGRCDMSLSALDAEAVAGLVAGFLDGAPPEDLVRTVAERTAGNAFFVREIVLSLLESGALVREDGAWRVKQDISGEHIPPTIEAVLSARIDQLPRHAASVLRVAAVVGRRVRVELLEHLVPPHEDVNGALRILLQTGFLNINEEPGIGELVFHHALIQDVAYSQLLKRRRRELHRKVAETAQRLYGVSDDVIDLLARHLYLADAGEPAIDALVRAARRARRMFATEEAIEHLRRAAELGRKEEPASRQLPDVLVALGNLHELGGEFDEALRCYAEARTLARDVRAWCGTASVLRKQGRYDDALAVLDEASADVDARSADAAPLWLERGWVLCVAARLDEASAALEQGLAAAGDRRDAVVGHLLLQRANAARLQEDHTLAMGMADRARAIFAELEDLHGLATAERVLGAALNDCGRPDDAVAPLRRALELAERIGSVEDLAGSLLNLSVAAVRRRRWSEAAAAARRAITEFERIGLRHGCAIGYANLAEALVGEGEYDEAHRYCEKALSTARELGHRETVADALQTMARVLLRRGRASEAAERAQEAATLNLDMGATSFASDCLRLAAEAWERAAEPAQAAAARARADALAPSLHAAPAVGVARVGSPGAQV